MARLDLTPLFRSSVGFDHLASMLDAANRVEQPAYPPYNIVRVSEDKYQISMAVAGFTQDELDIESEQNMLKITGLKRADEQEREYLHRGIAARNFERKFQLADHVKVTGASIENGLLHVDLEREIPDAMKPRKIAISGTSVNAVENVLEAEKQEKVA